jgi:hypothetical protein
MYRLAALHGRSVEEILDYSYEEITLWAEFYQMEPWGDWPKNVRSAHLVSTLANINRDPNKRSEPFGLEDFMLWKQVARKAEEIPAEGAKIDAAIVTWFFAKAGVKHVD